MLEDLLAKLNGAIASHNREVDDCIESGLHTEESAAGLRWNRQLTAKCVFESNWPAALMNIVGDIMTPVDAPTVVRLAKSVKVPTEITRDLCKGAAQSRGMIDSADPPVLVKLIQLAHLFARSADGRHDPIGDGLATSEAGRVRQPDRDAAWDSEREPTIG